MSEYQPAQLERIPKPSIEHAPLPKVHAPAVTHPIVGLQARAGNQAIARMVQRQGSEEDALQGKHDASLQRETEGGEAEEEELQAKHDASLQRESEGGEAEEEELQAKHDASLQRESEGGEAEEEELQAKHDASLQRESEGGEAEEEELQAKHDASLQRESEGAEDEGEEPLQAKHDSLAPQVGLEGGPVGDDIQGRINSMRGGGSAPPEGIRRQMEAATGANLGSVRVHEGSDANALNHQLTAKAFTTGNDIFLRGDQSSGNSELMAHEMAHVVQQSSGRVAAGSGGMQAGAANDPLESEADSLAHSVLSGSAQRHAEEHTA
jgi:hypothetical protein